MTRKGAPWVNLFVTGYFVTGYDGSDLSPEPSSSWRPGALAVPRLAAPRTADHAKSKCDCPAPDPASTSDRLCGWHMAAPFGEPSDHVMITLLMITSVMR